MPYVTMHDSVSGKLCATCCHGLCLLPPVAVITSKQVQGSFCTVMQAPGRMYLRMSSIDLR
jgi:hypothetical protein